MVWRDFREFLAEVERQGDVAVVEGADCDLEIGSLTELLCERNGPMLLFDNIKGYPKGYRVASKPYATPLRTSIALGLPADRPALEVVQAWRDKTRDYRPIKPEAMASGPVMENVLEGDAVDLTRFPAPKWHEADGGPYIGTGCAVITRDPDDGWVNAGTYRAMLHDSRTTGMEIGPYHHGKLHFDKWWAMEKSCPIAVAITVDPYLFLAATNGLPYGTSEYDYAGFLKGEPEEVIIGPKTGLPLPANAELVFEGEVPPPSVEQRLEGPFGEYTGYYAGGQKPQPVIRVQAIYHRTNPILHGDPPLKPPIGYWGCQLMGSHLVVWEGLEKTGQVGIKGVYPLNAGGNMITVISMRQHYAGHASQVGRIASGLMHGANHVLVLVDEDIDPSSADDVLWAIATRSDPAGWEIHYDCPASTLDPTVSPDRRQRGDFRSNRAMINACRPWSWIKEFPRVNRASDELRSRTLEKWRSLFDAADARRARAPDVPQGALAR